ncbi:putative kinesin [Trypanosoma rangeli]|uniref:Kinesin-like protein n=1 Tax=Trypanosoma rangeli TaxID=5698 RepID=A0A3R7K8C1_TRYRA|nr:putative kinesin [Trypanosoma rangeli]RNF03423.1 putative kinesin [Trypanosoma rangeli]|eukprot:RNF03423.1 putative kinesin [Trypanosoma rangeli]
MGKPEGIRIFLRIRPATEGLPRPLLGNSGREAETCGYAVEHTFEQSTVHFHVERRAEAGVVNNAKEDYKFTFRRAFEPSATQEEVFNVVAKDCVVAALDGYNSTIFAYGQTGSGKTYSITGGAESYEDRGIIPRALALIYDEVARRQQEGTWSIAVSYLQIYNDKGQDLLNHGRDARRLEDLPTVTIHDVDDEEVLLKGLAQHGAPNVEEALNLLFLGDTNRLYCETPMNKTSSRSHCVFTIYLETRAHGSSVVRHSKLNLVDLAGSERVAKTGVSGTVLTEAKHINLSLHYLEQVIMALSEQASGRREHVPFRNSFMTMVLRDSLGGNCRTSMLATAHLVLDHLPETISTCRFAQRVALICQNAHINEEVDAHLLVRKLKMELQQLRDQLAFYTKDGGGAPDRELTDDEKQRCQDMVRRYVSDTGTDVRIEGFDGDLARIYYCFDVMKRMLASGGGGGGGVGFNASVGSQLTQQQSQHPLELYRARIDALELSLQQKENEMNMLFGVLQKTQRARFNVETQTGATAEAAYCSSSRKNDDNNNNGVPTAVVSARAEVASQGGAPLSPSLPQQLPENGSQTAVSLYRRTLHDRLEPAQLTAVDEFFRKQEQLNEVYDLSALTDADLLKDRATAFEAFHRSYRHCAEVEDNKRELKQRYDACKTTARQLNDAVDRIKHLKAYIQRVRAERALQGVETIDTAEQTLLEELTATKATYNDLATSLRRQKEEIDAMHMFMKRSQEQLTRDFEDWLQIRKKQLAMATSGGVNASGPVPAPALMTNTSTPSVSSPLFTRQNILQSLPQQQTATQRRVTSMPNMPFELPPLRKEAMTSARMRNGNNTWTSVSRGMSEVSGNISSPASVQVNAPSGPLQMHPATAPPALGMERTSSSAPPNTLIPMNYPPVGSNDLTGAEASALSVLPVNHVESNGGAPNPYAPEHRSTGDAAADKQLAALYKARDSMRQRLQS